MRNNVDPGAAQVGVGREVLTYPGSAGSGVPRTQDLVANGLAFSNPHGDLFIADTARGAIWKVEFKGSGMLKSKTGCDETFTANTLCMGNVYVAHPLLEGADGIALDNAGNIFVVANERQAIVVVTPAKEVIEVFRNEPDMTTDLRNEGPLETPTSPFLIGTTFCTTNSNGRRRDNFPRSGGEVTDGSGKVNCVRQNLSSPGLLLPVGP